MASARRTCENSKGVRRSLRLLWDGQVEPLLLPLAEFRDLFDEAGPASDGQFKAQVYTHSDQPAELYLSRVGRHNVEAYFGWEPLLSALASARDETPPLDHSQVQTLLGSIGNARGLDVWVPPSDRSKMDWGLAPRFPFRTTMPPGLDSELHEIDVVWMARGGNTPVSLYEVEHSTPIYSGLLRSMMCICLWGSRPNSRSLPTRRGAACSPANSAAQHSKQAASTRLCSFMTNAEVFRWHQRMPK